MSTSRIRRDIDWPFFSPVIQDIALGRAWSAGTGGITNPVSANTNRLLVLVLSWEAFSPLTDITSITLDGVAGTEERFDLVETSGVQAGVSVHYWTNAQLDLIGTNPTLVINWVPSTPTEFSISSAIYTDVDQVSPIVASATDTSTSSTHTVNTTIASVDGGAAIAAFSSGNSTTTIDTNPFTLQLNQTLSSQRGAVWGDVDTLAPTEAVNYEIEDSNRSVFSYLTLRKAT